VYPSTFNAVTAIGNRLTDMEFDEISLVNRPANQLSKVVLFKSDAEAASMTDESVVQEETTIDDDEMTEDSIDKGGMYGHSKGNKKRRRKKGAPEILIDDEEGDVNVTKDDIEKDSVDLPSEVYEYISALEAANSELTEQLSKNDEAAQQEAEQEDILKAADPEIVAIVKAAEERAEAAEVIAKAERDFRLEREFVSKASSLDNLSVDADAFGKVLKTAAEALPKEDFDMLLGVLEGANSSVEAGAVFAEVGKSGGFDNDGPTSALNKAAASLREIDSDLTPEQAIAKAVTEDPTLYQEYLKGEM
jgi:hypothetical protein